jgi:hypothetical protein
MVGLLLLLVVSSFVPLVAMAGLCCILYVTYYMRRSHVHTSGVLSKRLVSSRGCPLSRNAHLDRRFATSTRHRVFLHDPQ